MASGAIGIFMPRVTTGGMSHDLYQTRLGANSAQGNAWLQGRPSRAAGELAEVVPVVLKHEPKRLAQVAVMSRSPRPYDSEIRTLRFPSHAVHPAHGLRGTMAEVFSRCSSHQNEDNP